MRVITGRAKGRKLMSVPGDSTRPITDRAKSALFSILSDWIEDTRVLDLFGGSGSTLIGAEQTVRKAFLVELDPLYCDVIVQRWEKFTGRQAERMPNVARSAA